jgi:hypothetical protein
MNNRTSLVFVSSIERQKTILLEYVQLVSAIALTFCYLRRCSPKYRLSVHRLDYLKT